MRSWYAVHAHRRAEHKASRHLSRQGFRTYLPRYLVQRSHARRRDWVERPLFPRYLFVHLDLEQDRWRAVYSTVGVRTLLSVGERPIVVPTEVVEEIRAREDSRGFVSLNSGRTFRRGDRVRVIEGPFLDLAGLFECRNDDERVIILLKLLGRQVKVSVPLRAISPAA